MHNIKSLVQNVRWLFIGTVLSNIISIFVTIFLIRKLPVAEFGIYSLFLGSLKIFQIFSVNGVVVSLRRYIPELIQKKYISYAKRLIKRLYLFGFTLSIFLVTIVFVLKHEVGILLQIKEFDVYYTIFIINILLYLQSFFNTNILTTLYEQKFLSVTNLISIIVRGTLYAIFLHAITIELIFIIEAISVGVKAISGDVYLFVKMKRMDAAEDITLNLEEKKFHGKRIRKYIALSSFNEMGESAFSQVSDYYFIAAFLGPGAIGLYAFPYKLLTAVLSWIPFANINQILKPYFIKQYYEAGENIKYLNMVYNILTKVYLLFLGFIFINVIAYQNLINIYLFNSKYLDTQLLLIIVIPFFLVRAFVFPNSFILEISENIQYNLYGKIFAVFNVVAVISVLKFSSWGIVGVGAATALSAILKNLYIYYFVKKKTSVTLNTAGFVKSLSLLFSIGLLVISSSYVSSLLLKIVLPGILGLCSIFIFTKLFNPFNSEEKKQLNKLFKFIPVKIDFMRRLLAFSLS